MTIFLVTLRKFSVLFLILCACLIVSSCSGTVDSPYADETEAPIEEFDIIKDGESIFNIIFDDTAHRANNRVAMKISEHLRANGITTNVSNEGDETGEVPEILIGTTKYFPMEAIRDIDLLKLGADGFVIKHYGNKILMAGNNDAVLYDAADFFIENFLDFENSKTSMPKDYCYIKSSGLFLSDMKIGGTDISKFTVTCDDGFEEPASYIKELVREKCGVTLSEEGEKKILLTADGAVPGTVTAKIENGDLVIGAAGLEEMKKAVVCFWYETVAYSVSTFDLPADTVYSRDLSKTVFYSDFNVKQSENECCFAELKAAHGYANENGFKVFADYGAKYYIATEGHAVDIYTDVEWGNAEFTVDDSGIAPDGHRGQDIFWIRNTKGAYSIDTVSTVTRDMTNLGVAFPQSSIVTFIDSTVLQYRREGVHESSGNAKRDMVVVDKDGNIDMDAPIMWDFDNITQITVMPMDEDTRYVGGGVFTTIANRAPCEYTAYRRGIHITRSNTVLNGTEHYVIGEGATGAPYNGFVYVRDCAYVSVKNCILTGHKTYHDASSPMGTYDIGMGQAISVTFLNCIQSNSITDDTYWGISGTNYCKNTVYDGCVLSRYDAHCGVTNGAIKNSVMGYDDVSIVGYGTFLVENSTFLDDRIFHLREDYGSSWEGDIIIRNCRIVPPGGNVTVIWGYNDEDHDFGYPCYMPKNVIVDGLFVDTTQNVYLFSAFNHAKKDSAYYNPLIPTEKVTVSGFSQSTNKQLILCENDDKIKAKLADTEFIQK